MSWMKLAMLGMKAGGALLVFFCCLLFGSCCSAGLRERAALLEEMQKGLHVLHQEITCMKTPLADALRYVGTRTDGTVARFFQGVAEELTEQAGEPFLLVWQENCRLWLDTAVGLKKTDRECFLQLGRQLEGIHREEKESILYLLEERLEEAVTDARKEYGEKAELYRKMGVLAGIFLVILFA